MKQFPLKNLLRLTPFLKPYKKAIVFGFVLTFLFTVFNGFTFAAVIPVVDTLTPGEEKFQFEITAEHKRLLQKNPTKIEGAGNYLKWLSASYKVKTNKFIREITKQKQLLYISVGILPLFFFRSFFNVAAIYVMRKVGTSVVRDIQVQAFAHLQKLSLEFFHAERTGNIMQRLTSDMIHMNNLVSRHLELLFRHSLTILIFLLAILYVNWEMSLLAMIALPIMVSPIAILTNKLIRLSKKQLSKATDITSYLQEKLNGIRIILAFGKEKQESEAFDKFASKAAHSELRRQFYSALSPSLVEFFSAIATALLFYYGGLTILEGGMSTGEFVFFLLALLSMITPIQQLARMSSFFYQGDAIAQRTLEILDRVPQITEKQDAVTLETVNKGIEFKKVEFYYETSQNKVLKDINFFIPAGKSIALVGPSGGGKSTIIDMVARFYDPKSGNIFIDDINLRELSIKWLRSQIAYVTQEIVLFSGTIRSNIAYGKADATDEDITQAAKAANAHRFIIELPHGYDTEIGERGVTLSGGQRQRLSIARALLSDPQILLLDEATSALDTESEKLVQDALNHLLEGRTSLVVAHRLSTIHGADKIIVIDRGEIVEMGNHDELLANNKLYKKLYDMQFQS